MAALVTSHATAPQPLQSRGHEIYRDLTKPRCLLWNCYGCLRYRCPTNSKSSTVGVDSVHTGSAPVPGGQAMPGGAFLARGIIKKLVLDRGFGFITPEGAAPRDK